MFDPKLAFCLIALLTFSSIYCQNIDELFQKADSGDAYSQYQVGILFYKVSLESKSSPQSNRLKEYYKKDNLLDVSQELDSLDVELYKEWVYANYVNYISYSAQNGNDKAQLALGKYYENLNEFGFKIRAYKWYTQSAENNNTEAANWISIKNKELYLKQYLKEDDYENIHFYVDLLDLSDKLCYQVNTGGSNKTLDKSIEKEIRIFLNITKDDVTYKTKLIDFWNNYNKFFICFDNNSIEPEHILKRSLNELFYKHNQILFNWLFELDKTAKIDFNQVIYCNSNSETILDFLETILKNKYEYQQFSAIDIIRLKDKLIVDYGAKTAEELKN
jgi:hypothetical protein